MKKLLIALTVIAAMLVGSVAFADDINPSALYKRCMGCHGKDGSTLAMGVGLPLKGQSSEELVKKMKGYVDGSYGSNKKKIMVNIVKRLSDEQLKALGDYIASFK